MLTVIDLKFAELEKLNQNTVFKKIKCIYKPGVGTLVFIFKFLSF